jgi:hypothetical protein
MNRYLAGATTLGCTLSLLHAITARADTAYIVSTHVTVTLVDASGFYGGCMALIDKNPKLTLPACRDNWVSFSCTGIYAPKDLAYRMFETAQLALVTNKTVTLRIEDAKLHNGYCYASRIDLKQ